MTIATGASSRSTVKTPARTHAAPELRRSLHTRPDRAPAAHAIYQVTPAILAAAGDRTETGQSRRSTAGLGVSLPPDQDQHGPWDATRPPDDDTEPALTLRAGGRPALVQGERDGAVQHTLCPRVQSS